MTHLRQELKRRTQASHNLLDAAMSDADIASPQGFTHFLQSHQMGYDALLSRDVMEPMANLLQDLRDRCRADLKALGTRPIQRQAATPDYLDPLAIDYVIGGSSFGAEVLRRRWKDTQDASVRAASAYFSAPSRMTVWRSFLDDAASIPAESPRANQIILDANKVFGVFLAAAKTARQGDELTDARS